MSGVSRLVYSDQVSKNKTGSVVKSLSANYTKVANGIKKIAMKMTKAVK